MKLLGLVPNFYIHVSVSDLYIPMIGPRQTNRVNTVYKSLTDMNVEIGRQNIIMMFWK